MKLLNKLSIGKKLYSGFGLVLLFFIIAVAVGLIGLENLNHASGFVDSRYQLISAVEDLRAMNAELTLVFMDIIIDKSSGTISGERTEFLKQFKEELEEDEKNIMAFALTETEKNNIALILENFKKLLKTGEEELIPAVIRKEEDETLWVKIDDTIDKMNTQNQILIQAVKTDLQEEIKKAKEVSLTTRRRAWLNLIGILAVGFILGALITYFIRRSLVKPVRAMVERAGELAEGDVDMDRRLEVQTRDEIGKLGGLFNKFLNRLQELVIKINAAATQLNNSTERISSGGMELATRTNEQAASITETSTTIEEFTAILKQNSENTAETSSTLEKFNAEIQAKKDLITNVTVTMTEISESSKKIDNIVNVINDISFQTNLLALNAAVEAARAGEAGRGFAVVAAEVRNLAQKTAESSKTIQDIVTQNVESTQKGMELIKETSNLFEAIVKTFQEMADKIQQINIGSQEQSTGVEQINLAISQLEAGINRNASLVDEFSSTSKIMEANANELNQLMAHFRIGGAKAPRPEPPAKPSPAKKTIEKKKEPTREKPKKEPTKKAPPPPQAESEDDFFASDEGGFEEF